MDLGLVHDGRLVRFHAFIGDRPGGLSQLTNVIAEHGASVQQITHDRAFGITDFASVLVECTVEDRDAGTAMRCSKPSHARVWKRVLEAIRLARCQPALDAESYPTGRQAELGTTDFETPGPSQRTIKPAPPPRSKNRPARRSGPARPLRCAAHFNHPVQTVIVDNQSAINHQL